MPPLHRHPALWLTLVWALYIATWPLGHGAFFNDLYAAFAFGPLLMGAWLFGLRGAIASVFVFVPLQMALFLSTDHVLGWDAFAGREGAAAMGVMVLVTLFVGWMADANRRMKHLVHSQSDLVAVVSHEVRTPLTGVVGIARELQQSWSGLGEDMKKELVDLISQSAEEMAAIVEDLLTAAKAEQGSLVTEPSVTDLSDVARSVVEQLRLAVPVEGAALAWADPGRVRQVIRNLVVNASRYGGPELTLRIGNNGSSVWIEVIDDGIGISAPNIESLFRPHTADGRHPDSHGLGLALSYQLATLMRGDLCYGRRDGRTVFRFTLPKAVMPATPVSGSSGIRSVGSRDQVKTGR